MPTDDGYLTEAELLGDTPLQESGYIRELADEIMTLDKPDEFDTFAYRLMGNDFIHFAEIYALDLRAAYIKAVRKGFIEGKDMDAERREDLRELSVCFAEIGRFTARNPRGI